MKDEGKTVVFSSHLLNDAEHLCDRVAILVKGRLSTVDSVANLLRGAPDRGPSSLETIFIQRIENEYDYEPRCSHC